MKNYILPLLTITILLFSFNTPSKCEDDTKSKNRKHIEEQLENISSNDWETYGKCGALALNWNLDIEYAKTLIDKSISINSNYVNLETLGDYYYKIEDLDKELKYYYIALNDVMFKNDQDNLNRLQMKILTYSK